MNEPGQQVGTLASNLVADGEAFRQAFDDASRAVDAAAAAKPPSRRARLTVKATACHEPRQGDRPFQTAAGRDRWLSSDEQVYSRPLLVGEEWQPLVDKYCWLPSASLLLLENTATDPEAVIEIGVVFPMPKERRTQFSTPLPDVGPAVCWLARPGIPLLAEPADLSLLRLRCRKGQVRVLINLFPS